METGKSTFIKNILMMRKWNALIDAHNAHSVTKIKRMQMMLFVIVRCIRMQPISISRRQIRLDEQKTGNQVHSKLQTAKRIWFQVMTSIAVELHIYNDDYRSRAYAHQFDDFQ